MSQLFGHVADRLGHVRNAVTEVLQNRFDYFAKLPREYFDTESVNQLSRHVDSLQPVIAYIQHVRCVFNVIGRSL